MTDDHTVVLRGTDTSHTSKTVMLRAERGDSVEVGGLGEVGVAKRTQTYYGPSLLLDDGEQNWLLVARGPGRELDLYRPNHVEDGFRDGWVYHDEVSAELVGAKQYDICSCGEPLKTVEHAKAAAFGVGEHG